MSLRQEGIVETVDIGRNKKTKPNCIQSSISLGPKRDQTQDIRISTGPVRTCENQSPLGVLILPSIC